MAQPLAWGLIRTETDRGTHPRIPRLSVVGSVKIEVQVRGEDAQLDLFDVLGRRVRRFVLRRTDGGQQALRWDGRTSEGTTAASGLYFLRLSGEREVRYHRLMLLR